MPFRHTSMLLSYTGAYACLRRMARRKWLEPGNGNVAYIGNFGTSGPSLYHIPGGNFGENKAIHFTPAALTQSTSTI